MMADEEGRMTDATIHARFAQAKAEAERTAMSEAHKGRNQAIGVFAFFVVVLAVLGSLSLDQAVEAQVLKTIEGDTITELQAQAKKAKDSALKAATDATTSAQQAGKERDRAARAAKEAGTLSNLLPIGSIIAWHKNVEGIAVGRLPEGWVECNGPILPGDQPDWAEGLDLSSVPNLNSVDGYAGGRFLRGGAHSGRNQPATGVHHSMGWPERLRTARQAPVSVVNEDGPASDDSQQPISIWVRYLDKTKVPLATKREVELKAVRPVNMSVVWILRVK